MSWVGFIYCIESGLSISFLDVQVSSCFITTIICHLAFVSDRFKAVLLHEITLKLTATVLNIQNLFTESCITLPLINITFILHVLQKSSIFYINATFVSL